MSNLKNELSDEADLDSAITSLAETGLARFLSDVDLSKRVVEYLAEETGLPKAVCRVAVKLAAILVENAAIKSGKWLGKVTRQRLSNAFLMLPKARAIADAFKRYARRIDKEVEQEQDLKAVLAGKRPARSLEEVDDLSLDLRAHAAQLRELEEMRNAMQSGFAEIIARLTPDPPLSLRRIAPSHAARFHYAVQRVPFLGRDTEMQQLEDFLHAETNFCWWLVLGPGGMGKSRLALELINRHGEPWRAGFLDHEESFEWSSWQPDQPTLIVADYAAERGERLGQIARTLHRRAPELDFPVRLLLLERETQSEWWKDFQGASGTAHEIEQAKFGEPMLLESLSHEAVVETIWFILDEAKTVLVGAEIMRVVLAQLYAIDPQMRPLFAAFLADALTRDPNPRKWDRQALLTDVLEKEQARWKVLNARKQDRSLLALATMCGGLEEASIANANVPKGLIPGPLEVDASRLAVMAGGESEDRLAPLEPDILGEFFVLEHFATDLRNTAARSALKEAAWALAPDRVPYFMLRTFFDHREHPNIKTLLEPPEAAAQHQWMRLSIDLLALLGTPNDLGLASHIFENSAKIAAANDATLENRIENARGAVNLIFSYGEARRFDDAERLYRDLTQNAAAPDATPEIRIQKAHSAVNLIASYGKARLLDDAERLYRDLTLGAAAHDATPEIRIAKAKGAFNLLDAYRQAERFDDAERLYRDLTQDAAAPDATPEIRLHKVQSAVNLIASYGEARLLDDAERLYQDMTQDAAAHNATPEIRIQKALGAYNLLDAFRQVERFDDAERLYRDMTQDAAAPDATQETCLQKAKGAFNLLDAYRLAERLDDAERLYRDLTQDAAADDATPEIRLQKANGAVNLISSYGDARRFDDAERLYRDLTQDAAADDATPEIRLQKAKGAFNLLDSYRKAERFDDAERLYRDLTQDAAGPYATPENRLQKAKGAFNLLDAYRQVERFDDAERLYRDLTQDAAGPYATPENRLQKAKGAFNLLNSYREAERFDDAEQKYVDLEGIAIDVGWPPGNQTEMELLEAWFRGVGARLVWLKEKSEKAAQAALDKINESEALAQTLGFFSAQADKLASRAATDPAEGGENSK